MSEYARHIIAMVHPEKCVYAAMIVVCMPWETQYLSSVVNRRLVLLDTYSVHVYVSTLPTPIHDAPIRYISVDDTLKLVRPFESLYGLDGCLYRTNQA
jgi:hypothetical protein